MTMKMRKTTMSSMKMMVSVYLLFELLVSMMGYAFIYTVLKKIVQGLSSSRGMSFSRKAYPISLV
jgi:hypothetical protein